MPAKSKSQHRMMCLAIAIKEGKVDGGKFPKAAEAAKSMSMEQLRDY